MKKKNIRLKTKNYGKKLFEAHFEYAQKVADKKLEPSAPSARDHAQKTIEGFLTE